MVAFVKSFCLFGLGIAATFILVIVGILGAIHSAAYELIESAVDWVIDALIDAENDID